MRDRSHGWSSKSSGEAPFFSFFLFNGYDSRQKGATKKAEMLFPGSPGSDCGKALAQMAAINSLLQKAD
jgi:hypothetical protein